MTKKKSTEEPQKEAQVQEEVATTSLGDKLTAAQEKRAAKLAGNDPFALPDLGELMEKAEDLEEARRRAEEQAAKEAAEEEQRREFADRLGPWMEAVVESREKARGISPKNFREFDDQITGVLSRKAVRDLASTAFVLAAANGESGISDTADFFGELDKRSIIRETVAGEHGAFSYRGRTYVLNFQTPEGDVRAHQAIRERFGEADRAAREEYRDKVRALLATSQMTVHEFFGGKIGRFAFFRHFELVEGKKRDGEPYRNTFKPGVVAGESDGREVVFTDGLGGCERIVQNCHKAGLRLSLQALNDEGFWTKKEELKPLVPVHRTLWAIRTYAEEHGQSPEIEKEVAGLKKKQTITPEELFAGKKDGVAFVDFSITDKGPWKLYGSGDRDRRRYEELHNVAALLEKKGGEVSWTKVPAHLYPYFRIAIGKNLEPGDKKKEIVSGMAAALYRAIKGYYAAAARAAEKETRETK